MTRWEPNDAQRRQWEGQGYFLVRGLLPHDTAVEMRGAIRNHILTPDLSVERQEIDPMDPMGDAPEARAARLRKLAHYGYQAPLLWHALYTAEPLLSMARHFLGDDLLVKYTSCFLKPARTGSETPWHQDNGLWRDGETEPFNFWMALDPATRENGCLQIIPGSHRTEIIPHVFYPDSHVHAELPRHRVREQVAAAGGVHHIELAPGDAVCWHSTLWHYSPPNTSEKGRIGIAGVYSTPVIAARRPFRQAYRWALKAGEVCTGFPPHTEEFGDPSGKQPDFERVAAEPESVLAAVA